jgi:transcriptional regulator
MQRVMVHPWDEARQTAEWRDWLAEGRDFGTLVANGVDGGSPDVVPTHFFFSGESHIALHLARANPVWRAIEANSQVSISVVDDYAFVPGPWRVPPGGSPGTGVPTSYYTAVVFEGVATVVADQAEKARLLAEQMRVFQPEGGYGDVAAAEGPYARMLTGILFTVIRIERVRAKFKFDDHKGEEHQASVSRRLAARGGPLDGKAKAQLDRRRLSKIPGT